MTSIESPMSKKCVASAVKQEALKVSTIQKNENKSIPQEKQMFFGRQMFLLITFGRDIIYREIFGVEISFQKTFGRELIFRDSLVEISPQSFFGSGYLFFFSGRDFLEVFLQRFLSKDLFGRECLFRDSWVKIY